MPVLVIEKGSDKGKSVPIEKEKTIVIGREAGCDLEVDDTLISRRHCQVVADPDGECAVEDLQSMNGTFLNGKRVATRTPLAFGDTIGIGLTRIAYLEGEKQKKKGALSGKTILGYEVGERIGRGGMGTVYRAMQISLSREVALKFLSADLTRDQAFKDKFVQEARSAGALNHPNIIQVYDVTEFKGLHFFSMEYASRGSVEDMLGKSERLPLAETVRIILDAARGLEYAHRKGIVHRDIKPDNLMVADDGTVKIGDMGLALNTQTNAEGDDKLGNFGTPHFASPEQIKGATVDIRSDLYSLGATFYRILAGRTPFVGKNVREIMMKQVKEPPPPIDDFVPDVPRPVAEVIERLLAKDPALRFSTPTDLIAELEKVQGEISLGAPSATGAPWRPSAAPLAVGAIVIALALGGLWLLERVIPDDGPGGGNGTSDGTASGEDEEARRRRAQEALRTALDRDPLDPRTIARLEQIAADYAGTPAGAEAKRRAAEAAVALRQRREAEAQERFELARSQRYDPAGSAIPSKAAAERLEAIARDYPETAPADRARALAAEIRTEIDAYLKVAPGASSAWTAAEGRVEAAESRREFGAALRILDEYAGQFDHPEFRSRAERKRADVLEDARKAFEAAISTAAGRVAEDEYDEAIAEMEKVQRTFGIEEYVPRAAVEIEAVRRAKADYESRTAADRLDRERREVTTLGGEVRDLLVRCDTAKALARLDARRREFQTQECLSRHEFLVWHVSVVQAYLDEFATRARGGRLARKGAELPPEIVDNLRRTWPVDRGEIKGLKDGEVSFEIEVGAGGRIVMGARIDKIPKERLYDILVGATPRWELSVEEQFGALGLAVALDLPDRVNQWMKALDAVLKSLTGEDVEALRRRLETYKTFERR